MLHAPSWMDDLKAKSPDMGGQTLAQHTWDVLARMADQRRLHVHLSAQISEKLWTQAFWAAFLHDFGKAAAGFQQVLAGHKGPWSQARHRHEVLSLAFVDWLFPRSHPDRANILAMIVCHHKDRKVIFDKYGNGDTKVDPYELKSTKEQLSELADNISPYVRGQLWRWLHDLPALWAADLGFEIINQPVLIPYEDALSANLAKAIFHALADFQNVCRQPDSQQTRHLILLRGLILSADHAASAGVGTLPDMPAIRVMAETALGNHPLRPHQHDAEGAATGSLILVAPTGSGKTEAALLWAARQLEAQPSARLFYTLPYQASMNAMHARLGSLLPEASRERTIAIRHSRALLKHYQEMMQVDELTADEASRRARWLMNQTDLNVHPIQVFSPYQMLKAAYALKGYEALVLDYADGLFIFDEIHAYDAKRLALIIEMMRWLREGFGARFLVMTATLPPMIRQKLADALACDVIGAQPEEFERSQRHQVVLLDGRLTDSIAGHVAQDISAGRRVLVCVNRVADAQRVYQQLKDLLAEDDIVLLHSRFNARDRGAKEKILLDRAGVGNTPPGPFVCVATQVVEVSLNVDFDTIYTDPAPLEALLQRFGRVNRGRKKKILLPVHVFTQPGSEGKDPYLPYKQTLVDDSLRVLRSYCDGRAIDESLVTTMLDEIYSGTTLAGWNTDYDKMALEFRRDILGIIRPFQSAEWEIQQKFYKLFDGIEVVPESCDAAYYEAVEKRRYLDARQYVVGISHGIYHEFRGYGRICTARELEGEPFDHIAVEYDAEYGLRIDEARQEIRAQKALGEMEDDFE
jgi:CRISPR-associated endonuclease/helicase Cas3